MPSEKTVRTLPRVARGGGGGGAAGLARIIVGAAHVMLRRGRSPDAQLRQELAGVHEELFHIRGEPALARAELERTRSTAARRDVPTLEELLSSGTRREVEAVIRAGCHAVPLADGTVLCRMPGRYKLFVDAQDAGLAPHLLLDGFWAYWITELISRSVGRGEVAFHVGATYGYYTTMLAELVGPEGRIRACEPNPRLHALLVRNMAASGLGGVVETHAVAVADRSGDRARLWIPLADPQSAHLVAGDPDAPEEVPDGVRQLGVPVVALDDLAGDGPVDFIKMDTVGGRGARLGRHARPGGAQRRPSHPDGPQPRPPRRPGRPAGRARRRPSPALRRRRRQGQALHRDGPARPRPGNHALPLAVRPALRPGRARP